MVAYQRRDVAALNDAARDLLRPRGLLRRDEHPTPAGVGLARGDRVLCLSNDSSIQVTNGTRGTIMSIRGARLLLRTDERSLRAVPFAYVDAGHVAHA